MSPLEEQMEKMKKMNPHALVMIGWWAGGNLELSLTNAPLETLTYMHALLGATIQDRFKQLGQGLKLNEEKPK